jgi:hypothetical protein
LKCENWGSVNSLEDKRAQGYTFSSCHSWFR